jgi:hypothetical protein
LYCNSLLTKHVIACAQLPKEVNTNSENHPGLLNKTLSRIMPNNGNLLEDLVANNGNDLTPMTQKEHNAPFKEGNSSERFLPQNKSKGKLQCSDLSIL